MNSFDDAKLVEQKSLKILRPFIEQRSYHGQYVIVNDGPLARELQAVGFDIIMQTSPGSFTTIDIKAENENKHDNFYVESWSNKSRWRRGWFFTIKAELLFYHFVEDYKLYVIEVEKLRRWAFSSEAPDEPSRIYRYPERDQKKRMQKNDTWGFCVPILHLERAKLANCIDLTALVSDSDHAEIRPAAAGR